MSGSVEAGMPLFTWHRRVDLQCGTRKMSNRQRKRQRRCVTAACHINVTASGISGASRTHSRCNTDAAVSALF